MSFFAGLKTALEAVVREAPTLVFEHAQQMPPAPLAGPPEMPLTDVQKAFMDRLYMEFEVFLMGRRTRLFRPGHHALAEAYYNECHLIDSLLRELRAERAVLRGYAP
jgi:hypothetical protein